ncbi:MAG TPA: GNAT family N-acetyltransferase [Acidimicrobiia bacterium]|nr:GNAT family N-acetyltransferase [Acidimicrobiia bacterium]
MSDHEELVVRVGRPEDADGIVALVNERIGTEDGPEARLTLDDPRFGPGGWTVAADGDRIVSVLGLFPASTRVGSVAVQSAFIEFVATARDYEGRGLVRDQMELAHRISAERGDLIMWMVGIPYFYRQFGYEYAVPTPPTIAVTGSGVGAAPDLSFRVATADDIDTVTALQGHMAASAVIVAEHDQLLWSWYIASPVYRVVIAERQGTPVGMMRIYDDDGHPLVFDVAAGDPATFLALAGEAAGPGGTATVALRPGLEDFASGLGETDRDGYAYYTRVPDPCALLEAVLPELNFRMADSGAEFEDGELLISLYRESITAQIRNGQLESFGRGGTVQAPVSQGGCGVPPDLIAHLILGPLGALELERRHADVLLGRRRELMDVLFPPQTVDVQSWVWP